MPGPKLVIPRASSIYPDDDVSPPDSPRTSTAGARSSSPNISPVTDAGSGHRIPSAAAAATSSTAAAAAAAAAAAPPTGGPVRKSTGLTPYSITGLSKAASSSNKDLKPPDAARSNSDVAGAGNRVHTGSHPGTTTTISGGDPRSHKTNIPAPAAKMTGSTTAFLSGWREKIAAAKGSKDTKLKWDAYSGEPTDSLNGRSAQVVPGSTQYDRNGMSVTPPIGRVAGATKPALFGPPLAKLALHRGGPPSTRDAKRTSLPPTSPTTSMTNSPTANINSSSMAKTSQSPTVTTPTAAQPREQWHGPSGRTPIFPPVAEKPRPAGKSLPTPSQRRQQGLRHAGGIRTVGATDRDSPVAEKAPSASQPAANLPSPSAVNGRRPSPPAHHRHASTDAVNLALKNSHDSAGSHETTRQNTSVEAKVPQSSSSKSQRPASTQSLLAVSTSKELPAPPPIQESPSSATRHTPPPRSGSASQGSSPRADGLPHGLAEHPPGAITASQVMPRTSSKAAVVESPVHNQRPTNSGPATTLGSAQRLPQPVNETPARHYGVHEPQPRQPGANEPLSRNAEQTPTELTSRFSSTTYDTQAPDSSSTVSTPRLPQDDDPPTPPPPPPLRLATTGFTGPITRTATVGTPTSSPSPTGTTSSILDRKRPIPASRPSVGSKPPSRKPTPSDIQMRQSLLSAHCDGPDTPRRRSERSASADSTAHDKSLPAQPTSAGGQPPVDRITQLEAKMTSLRRRQGNLATVIHELTVVVQPSSIAYDLASRQEVKRTVASLQIESAAVAKELHDTGLALHRALKRRDENAWIEPTGLWVRRVTE